MFTRRSKHVFLSLCLFSLLFTACGKYTVEVNLTPEQEALYEQQIEESKVTLEKTDASDADKITAYDAIGVAYQQMGQYKKAIEAYEDALRLSATDFVALNNSADIYQTIGETERASRFLVVLLSHYPHNQQVVGDFIRVAVAIKNTDAALRALEQFAAWASTQPDYEDYTSWISMQYVNIGQADDAQNQGNGQ